MDQNSQNARWMTIWFAAISTFLVFALLPFTKVSFAFTNLVDWAYFIAAYGVIATYCWKRNLVRLAPALEGVFLGILITSPTLIASYMAASVALPLMDDTLVRADEALGFDWRAFISFIDAHDLLARTLANAYSSFAIQLLAIPFVLAAAGRYARVYVMILAYGLIVYLACAVSIWFPALGTYVVYGVAQDNLQNINAHYGFAFLADFNAVREQPAFVLTVQNASGIITFPSVHAAGAFLCAWAAWDLKAIRYPLAAWNALMATSAVSHANHYLVDVVAGVAIAALAIILVEKILSHMQRKAWLTPSPIAVVTMLMGRRPQEDAAGI